MIFAADGCPNRDLERTAGSARDARARARRRPARGAGARGRAEPGVFGNTAASELLAREGWDDFAHLFANAWLQAAGALYASGEESFSRVHGSEFWAWLAAHPHERAGFDRRWRKAGRAGSSGSKASSGVGMSS